MIVIFSGPSGAGKSTIINILLKDNPECILMPTMTTRAPRPGESEGSPYYFVSKEQFAQLIKEDEFFEYQVVHENYYGTNKRILKEKVALGKTLLKDIDVWGTMELKKRTDLPCDILCVFVTTDKQTLKQRLEGRGDSPEQIRLRLSRYEEEEKYEPYYDYVIVNEDAFESAAKIKAFIEKRKNLE